MSDFFDYIGEHRGHHPLVLPARGGERVHAQQFVPTRPPKLRARKQQRRDSNRIGNQPPRAKRASSELASRFEWVRNAIRHLHVAVPDGAGQKGGAHPRRNPALLRGGGPSPKKLDWPTPRGTLGPGCGALGLGGGYGVDGIGAESGVAAAAAKKAKRRAKGRGGNPLRALAGGAKQKQSKKANRVRACARAVCKPTARGGEQNATQGAAAERGTML